jgi:FkbM family methyltransferase
VSYLNHLDISIQLTNFIKSISMKTNNKIWRIYQRLFYNLFGFVLLNHKGKYIKFKGPNFSQVFFVFYILESINHKIAFNEICKKLNLQSELHIIDIGSNIGWMALYMDSIISYKKRFSLVEPVFQNYIYLKNNTITLNKSIYNIGLSDSETSLSIGTPNTKSNDTGLYSKFHNSNLVTIPCKKFDDVFFDEKNIDLIKIDVEGMELDVLYSAKKSLIKFKPILYFEINKTIINDYDKISTFLTSLGYEEFANDYFKIDHTLLKYDVIWQKIS